MTRSPRPRAPKPPTSVPGPVSALDVIEEAIFLLRAHPSLLVPYLTGSLPFVLALLYFWADMLRSPFAARHVAQASLGVTLLFFWMKSWQTVFVQQALARARHLPPPRWSAGRIWRMTITQIMIQGWGCALLPLSLAMVFPFAWAYAYYQNVCVYGHGDEPRARKRAWQQARLWPKQNLVMTWLLSPWLLIAATALIIIGAPLIRTLENPIWWGLLLVLLVALTIPLNPIGMVIAVNLAAAILMLPWLAQTLFGIESVFTLSGAAGINTTLAAMVCALTYLCLDPVAKTAYALRCFYGESLRTGEDLRAALRLIRQPAAMVLICGAICGAVVCGVGPLASSPACAQEVLEERPLPPEASLPPASVAELDAALKRVLNRAEYSWRMPRETVTAAPLEPRDLPPALQWIADGLEGLGETLRNWGRALNRWRNDFRDWWRERFRPPSPSRPGRRTRGEWMLGVQALAFVLLAAIASVLAVLLWRFFTQRRTTAAVAAAVAAPPDRPDVARDDVDAAALPEDGWLAMARELLAQGQTRLALRAMYLATLACLAERELITIARFKSDRDYAGELNRRAHAHPDLPPIFADNMLAFQRAWYGLHPVDQAAIDHFAANYRQLKTSAS
jgi:hypothetical protein